MEPSRHDGLAQLHQRYYPELVRLAFALTGDWSLAEELAQEAFVRAWRSWGSIRRKQSAPAYLRATVVNLARTSLRQRLREIRAWRDVATPPQAEAAVSPDVLHALASLPHRKRACVVLRYYLDLSEADTRHPTAWSSMGHPSGALPWRSPQTRLVFGPSWPTATTPASNWCTLSSTPDPTEARATAVDFPGLEHGFVIPSSAS